jgi:hypothetical protein
MIMKKKSIFDADKYINRNYVENEDAIISIYIKDADDYYNEFDADDLTLSDDILSFINNRVENISYKYNIVLEFDSPVIALHEKKKLLNIIKSHYGLAYSLKQKASKANKLKALIFFVIGIIMLLLSYFIGKYVNLISEILLIAGWVAVWETVSVIFFDNIKVMTNKRNIDRLYNAKIIFKERKK